MFNGAFDSLWIMFIIMFLLIAGLGIYAIPSKKVVEITKFQINDNLTCYKTYKAILVK